jgi:hypothetical protein
VERLVKRVRVARPEVRPRAAANSLQAVESMERARPAEARSVLVEMVSLPVVMDLRAARRPDSDVPQGCVHRQTVSGELA